MKRNLLLTLAAMLILVLALGGCAAPASNNTSDNAAPTTSAPAATTAPEATAPAASQDGLKDGTYKAAYDNFDSHGWKATVQIDVKDGKIAACTFDYVNKDGKLKTQDADYNSSMKAQNGTSPAEYSPKLAQSLVDTQDIAKVDSVTGATSSSNNFKTLAAAALEKAKTGDTSETTVPLPAGE